MSARTFIVVRYAFNRNEDERRVLTVLAEQQITQHKEQKYN